MKKNIGPTDRIIRIAAGIILGIIFFANIVSGTLGIIVIILAALLLLFGLIGNCPLYIPFGINTCKTKESKA
jgi:hypothetical protein